MSFDAALIGFNRLASFAQGHVAFCFALFWNPMLRVICYGRNMPFRRPVGDCWGTNHAVNHATNDFFSTRLVRFTCIRQAKWHRLDACGCASCLEIARQLEHARPQICAAYISNPSAKDGGRNRGSHSNTPSPCWLTEAYES